MIAAIFRRVGRKIRQADAARDARQYRKAIRLYETVLRRAPDNAAIHIQCGHVYKEIGDLARAGDHYGRAKALTPEDPDLALQIGHFHRVSGRLEEAERSYREAARLDPDWAEPAVQLGLLYRLGWRDHSPITISPPLGSGRPTVPETETFQFVNGEAKGSWQEQDKWLLPELEARPRESALHSHAEEIAIRWIGHIGRTHWGIHNILHGIDIIRGFCVSAIRIKELRITINGLQIVRAPLQGFPLKHEKYDHSKRKYVFNVWYDFSQFREGRHELMLQFVDESGGLRVHAQSVVIAAPLTPDQHATSDRFVYLPTPSDRPLEEQINALPSTVRPARRALFATPPKNVLIQRVDQLGDVVISVPALRRLREFLPDARFVGLLSFANAELAESLNLFDEIIAIDFQDDEWERRRVMSLDQQYELRQRLEPYKFDVAIDLGESGVSRPLLLLSGAPFKIGFRDERCPWLSSDFEAFTRDPRNGHEVVSPATKLVGLIEWFGALVRDCSEIVRRDDLSRDRLASYGLSPQGRYAVLHTGARIKFSRWPHYAKLASMILEKTDLSVVMMSDDPATSVVSVEVAASDRFLLLDKRLPFDDFDAFLSFCDVFVGNDSGPSHLASLRGANVINIFLARHNWNEWGHQNKGYIVTRRVPCAGCNIHHDPEECGKDFACIVNIKPEEIFATIERILAAASADPVLHAVGQRDDQMASPGQ